MKPQRIQAYIEEVCKPWDPSAQGQCVISSGFPLTQESKNCQLSKSPNFTYIWVLISEGDLFFSFSTVTQPIKKKKIIQIHQVYQGHSAWLLTLEIRTKFYPWQNPKANYVYLIEWINVTSVDKCKHIYTHSTDCHISQFQQLKSGPSSIKYTQGPCTSLLWQLSAVYSHHRWCGWPSGTLLYWRATFSYYISLPHLKG